MGSAQVQSRPCIHLLQRNVELNEKMKLKGCAFPLPGKMEKAAVPSSTTTPCLSLQSGKTDQAVSRVNTVACCSHPASLQTAFDGTGWGGGSPLPATATAPARQPGPALSFLGNSTRAHPGAAGCWGQSQSPPT